MMLKLADLAACFEGVVPSIVATVAADGTPNISYLSHIVLVDDAHVGLSNQFFSKTAANLRANPTAALLVVDPCDGAQFRLDARFVETITNGPLFERVAAQTHGANSQAGFAGMMKLRSVDVFQVQAIRAVRSAGERKDPRGTPDYLARLAPLTGLTHATELDGLISAALDGLGSAFGFENLLLLMAVPEQQSLVTLGSFGYAPTGIGSEVAFGEGVIGAAAREQRVVRVTDMSRVRRLVAAVEAGGPDSFAAAERRTRTIALPFRPDAMSQIAVPLVAAGALVGVLFVESPTRLAFGPAEEQALSVLGRELAAALALASVTAHRSATPAAAGSAPVPSERVFKVVHSAFDDSVFIDGEYVIKGVSGRLLMLLLKLHKREGRASFANLELRHNPELRLTGIRDNFETRLLLLRRRLDEKGAPIRLVPTARGRFALELLGRPIVVRHEPDA